MSKKCVIVYDNPSQWKADVYYSDNTDLESAKRELQPFYLRDKTTEKGLEPFTPEEILAIERAEPTNRSILVREENVGGFFAYRKIVAGGELVPGFCDLHFNLDENKVKTQVIDFLANLGASEIGVTIKRSTEVSSCVEMTSQTNVSGTVPIGNADVDVKTGNKRSTGDKEKIISSGSSEKNDPNFEEAKRMIDHNSWFRDCFSGLYDRVKSGRTHGVQSETIEHHVVRDFYKNSTVAVAAAVRYKMVKSELKSRVESESKFHKDEIVSLTWTCVFP